MKFMNLINKITEGVGRSSRIYSDFFRDITQLSNVDKVISEHSTRRGHAFLLRGKDGNAYELQIHPAKHGDFFQEERKHSQFIKRKNH